MSVSHRIFILERWGAALQQALSSTGNDWERQEEMAPIGPSLAAWVTQGHRCQRKRQCLCRCEEKREGGEMVSGKYYI